MPSFREVAIPRTPDRLSAYSSLVPARTLEQLRADAQQCAPLTVLHINATDVGGGVDEILDSQVPMERELGLNSQRYVLDDIPPAFFDVTKKMHNLLQGSTGMLTEEEKTLYAAVNAELASHLSDILPSENPCVVVIHDPQPAPLIAALPANTPSILRLHIDLSTPNPEVMEFLRPFIQQAGRVVVSHEMYQESLLWLKRGQSVISYPAIDPFTEKNRPVSLVRAHTILGEFGINPDRPLIAQVSRFDPWKDPIGVIGAYRLAKKEIPDLQLLLAGFMLAQDDPEAMNIFEEVQHQAAGDSDIFLFADPTRLNKVSNDVFVNAVYTASTLLVQKSIREGFGLTMTEAMWKEKAVIAGNTAGAAIQIMDGANGVIVSSPEEAAEAIVQLANDERARTRLGRAAHASVRSRFLMTRLLGDFVKLYARLIR